MYQPTIQFLILWTVSFKGWKLEMETFLKKYLYFYDFYRIAYICKWWYQIYINYTEVWRQYWLKLFQWNFLSYRQKWDFKVFFVYDVIIYLNGINAYNFKWPSIYRDGMSDAPLKPSFLHRFWSKKCASHFCRETTNKNNQFSKWETWIFNAILDQ